MVGDSSNVFPPIEAASKPVFTTYTHIVIPTKAGIQKGCLSLHLPLFRNVPWISAFAGMTYRTPARRLFSPYPISDMELPRLTSASRSRRLRRCYT